MDPQTPTPPPASAPSEGYGKKIFSPKNIILYLVVALLAYGAIYYFFFAKDKSLPGQQNQDQSSQEQGIEQADIPSGPSPIIVTLQAQNNSGQDGIALLSEEDGKVKVSISVSNPQEGIPQPSHIHSGKCPTPGEVKYPLNDITVAEGQAQSETTIDAKLEDLKKGDLAINIHKSAQELTNYTSCGDITSE
jgi:hypothetical protein